MGAYFLKRLMWVPVTLLGIVTITFLLLFVVPGDPVANIVGQHADPATKEAIRKELYLDRPMYAQYLHYLANIARGDFGRSYQTNLPVLQSITERFPATLLLAFSAILVEVLIGIAAGVVSAVKQYSWLDRVVMISAIAGISAPGFWVGLLAIYYLSFKLQLFPLGGYGIGWQEHLTHLMLPALVLGLRGVCMIARLTRSTMLEVIRMDYIRAAQAKGLGPLRVIAGHALRNAMIPIATYIGLDLGALLGGAIITEFVFAWPGIGQLAVQALNQKDFPLVLGTVLFSSSMIVLANLATDLSYAWLDPRVRMR